MVLIRVFYVICLILFANNISAATSCAVILDRCSENNLGKGDAKLRNAWAAKCFSEITAEMLKGGGLTRYALAYNQSTGSWIAPLNRNASCNGWKLKAICVASCYTAEQQVLFHTGYMPIKEALEKNISSIMSLDIKSTLNDISLSAKPVKNYTRSWRVGAPETIRIITTEADVEIKITLNHPVFLATGKMTEARNLKVGDKLITLSGKFHEILSIKEMTITDKVYNVSPDSGNPIENIIVAQGYLMGSAAYQYMENFQNHMDRQLMRSVIELPAKQEKK